MADPGLPRAGGANSRGGAPTYDFAIFSQKLHEIERIWAPGGGGGRASVVPPLDPSLLCTQGFIYELSLFRVPTDEGNRGKF